MVEETKKTPKTKRSLKSSQEPEAKSFPIVAICASAGGLDALQAFFSSMPEEKGIAFVVIQHLDPTHKSLMSDLIKRYTSLPVKIIEDGLRVEPGIIYFNPPNREMTLQEGTFHLQEISSKQGVRLPIDHFLRSLAEERGENAICIILSGTGTDGTAGLREIKGNAGMVMVQDPEEAQYNGMPKSALETGLEDFVLPVKKMPEELLQYLKHPLVKKPEEVEIQDKQFEDYVQKIFRIIRSKTGHDFSNYKQNTIRRRIERRMAVHKIVEIKNYVLFLTQNPSEVEALFKDFLIKVTSFFRDTEAFEVLGTKIIPELIRKKQDDASLRLWVPGCASGEEAFSLAMLLVEAMDRLDKHLNVQIFASDIDPEAINQAREAQYPASIIPDVSEARLNRFFLKDGGGYKIKKQIRQMVVFAVQNLLTDPPFSKLDLVSCRNLLIYMGSGLQKKILPLFHYSLIQGGYLFLGTSETIGEFSNLFITIDKKWKIYQSIGTEAERMVDYPPLTQIERPPRHQPPEMKLLPKKANIRELAERVIIEDFAPPAVIIDEQFQILYFQGETDKYLTMPKGEPGYNILDLAREGLRHRLKAVVHKVLEQKRPSTCEGVSIKYHGEYLNLNLIVRPLLESTEARNTVMIIFQEKPIVLPSSPKKKKGEEKEKEDPLILALEQKLQSTREDLQTTIEELETSNEELKSSNEELQSSNEEAQSTNEELETSREELQSTNEELTTVNAELQNKVEELSQANNDINNLLSSTDVGILFLDIGLRIRRFTPAALKVMNLIPADVGRPIRDIAAKVHAFDFAKEAGIVLDTLQSKEIEVIGEENRWYFTTLRPYRTLENKIDGVVITFLDITKLKQSEQVAASARRYAESIVDTVREPLIILDGDFRVISANKSFFQTFSTSVKETEKKLIFELGNGQWNIPDLRKLLEEIIPQNHFFEDYRVSHQFPKIGVRTMLLNARLLQEGKDGEKLILLAMEDITGQISKDPE